MWIQEEQTQDSMKGQNYEGYQILSVVGSGTFGKVYKVKDIKTGEIYAMKHVLQNKKYKNRQLDIMKQINSNNCIRLHSHFYKQEKQGQFLNIVMEFVADPLSKTIKSNTPIKKYFNDSQVIRYTKCLLTGLRDLHSIDVCHRDIKPSNILIDENQAKICDFGSAKVLVAAQKNISYICSRYYRAPQLLLGAIYYSSQIDIWSLGCVIVQLMTNHALFEGSNVTSMLSKIIKCLGSPTLQDLKEMRIEDEEMGLVEMQGYGLWSRVQKLNPNCSQEMMQVVSRMIVYSPLKRITAAEALALPIFN